MDGAPSPAGTHVRRFGHGSRRVLAFHCSLAHGGTWRGVARHLEGVATVVAPDFPGHGRSAACEPPEDFPDRSFAMALDLLGDEPADLFGHSFGGVMALRLALERPDLVRSLSLFEPVMMAAADRDGDRHLFEADRALMQDVGRKVAAGTADKAARIFLRVWGDGRRWDTLSDDARAGFTAAIPLVTASRQTLSEDHNRMLAPGRLEAISVPVLLADGADSPALMPAVQNALAARIPRARRATVPGAGHMAPITHAEAVADLFRETLMRAGTP